LSDNARDKKVDGDFQIDSITLYEASLFFSKIQKEGCDINTTREGELKDKGKKHLLYLF